MPEILVVNENKVISAMVKKRIESELNYDVKCVHTHFDALKMIKNEDSNFIAGLVGLFLPDSPNGEIVDYIISKNIPTIVFTGELSDSVRNKIWSKKVVDYVLKEGGHNLDYIVFLLRRITRNSSVKVLVVDDSVLFRTRICDLIKVHLYSVFEAMDGNEAISILEKNPDIKLILTDYEMPNMDGFQLTQEVRVKYSKDQLAIIGISGDNSLSARFIKYGANDFISKDFFVEEFYCRVTQNIEMIEHVERIKDASNKDYLTDMYNRRYFFDIGDKLYANSKRKNLSVAVAMIDIDYFKKVNDTYGHDAGDAVIKKIAFILKNRFRKSDIVSRFGGEEFCVLVCNMDYEQISRIFNNLRCMIKEKEIDIGEKKINVKVSIGICCVEMNSLEEMIKRADDMLYKAKESGRDRVCLLK